MATGYHDGNHTDTLMAVSSADGKTPVVVWADPDTHRLLTTSAGGGSGLGEEVPGGTVDGSNTVFTVANGPIFVLADGIVHPVGATVNDYAGNAVVYSAGTITFNALTPPMQYVISYYNP